MRALRSHNLLDTAPDPVLDRIADLAAVLLDCPMAAISLVDHDRVWFKARIGIEPPELDRKVCFCSLAIENDEPTLIPDASVDPGTCDTALVTGDFHLRFYLGVPLKTRDGHVIGTLCAMDTRPRQVPTAQIDHLRRLAAITALELEQCRAARTTLVEMSSILREKDAALGRASTVASELRDAALKDALTMLANRELFKTRLQQRMDAADGSGFALLIIDLDHFKAINDSSGLPAGDRLLRQAADRIRRASAPADLVARLGGDEFAVIHEAAPIAGATRLAQALVDALAVPYAIDDLLLRSGASVGVAWFPDDSTDPAGLMRCADRALRAAKQAGRSRYMTFDHDGEEVQQGRFSLERDLRLALAANELHLVYQPIYDLRTGRIIGAEALARWMHPDHGLIAPDVFIPVAEESGLIHGLGLWALQAACREAAGWPTPVHVSVNCSPLQFLTDDLPGHVANVLRRTGLAPGRLDIEVTERLLLEDSDMVRDIMQTLRTIGCRLTLDDFGVGHAGLSYVRTFRFDRIKIDRSFVDDLASAGTQAIVEAILQLSRRLQVQTVAEGVERADQMDWLRAHDCDCVQGHMLSLPLDARDFASRLRDEQPVADEHPSLGSDRSDSIVQGDARAQAGADTRM